MRFYFRILLDAESYHLGPLYEKLPKSLYGGNFILIVNPPGQPSTDLYLFHDKTWAANATHMVGWSRELIHCLSLPPADWPHWLVGHSFKLNPSDNTYQLSGHNQIFSKEQLLAWAHEAQSLLAQADVTVCQWDSNSHEDWPAAITREHDLVVRHHSEKFHRQQIGDDLKFHVMRWKHVHEASLSACLSHKRSIS